MYRQIQSKCIKQKDTQIKFIYVWVHDSFMNIIINLFNNNAFSNSDLSCPSETC